MLQERLGRSLVELAAPGRVTDRDHRDDARTELAPADARDRARAPGANKPVRLRSGASGGGRSSAARARPPPSSRRSATPRRGAGAFDRSTAVLIHGDAHPANVLEAVRNERPLRRVQAHRSRRHALGAGARPRDPAPRLERRAARGARSRATRTRVVRAARRHRRHRQPAPSGSGRSSSACRPVCT